MGLDMYLYGVKDEYTHEYNIGHNQTLTQVGYWRKANAIHKWFVDNIQQGVDNCATYYVAREALKELLDICKAIIKDTTKAPELLPTQDGFFFGNTEYNEMYYDDILETMVIINWCLEQDYEYFKYSSSW